jgi:hypothetical protein
VEEICACKHRIAKKKLMVYGRVILLLLKTAQNLNDSTEFEVFFQSTFLTHEISKLHIFQIQLESFDLLTQLL